MVFDEISNLRTNLASFINSLNILGTTAGVIIAIAAGDMIRSFVRDIIFPSMYYLLKYKIGGEFSPIDSAHVSRFGKEVISFYTKDEFNEWLNKTNTKGWNTEYKKGLAALEDEEYQEIITNPKTIQISNDILYKESLHAWFGGDSSLRKKKLLEFC